MADQNRPLIHQCTGNVCYMAMRKPLWASVLATVSQVELLYTLTTAWPACTGQFTPIKETATENYLLPVSDVAANSCRVDEAKNQALSVYIAVFCVHSHYKL